MVLLAATLLIGAAFQGPDVVQCPDFRCEVSGVELLDGKVFCRTFCPNEDGETLRENFVRSARNFERLYSTLGRLDAQVHLEAYPSAESPILKLRVTEGDTYWIKRIEILTDRPAFDTESLRDELLIHEDQECNPDLLRISARHMRLRGSFKSSDVEIVKGPDRGQVVVRITLTGKAD